MLNAKCVGGVSFVLSFGYSKLTVQVLFSRLGHVKTWPFNQRGRLLWIKRSLYMNRGVILNEFTLSMFWFVFLNGLVSKPSLSTGLKLRQPSGTMELSKKVLLRASDFSTWDKLQYLCHISYDKKLENKVWMFTYVSLDETHILKKKKITCICVHLERRELLHGSLLLGLQGSSVSR